MHFLIRYTDLLMALHVQSFTRFSIGRSLKILRSIVFEVHGWHKNYARQEKKCDLTSSRRWIKSGHVNFRKTIDDSFLYIVLRAQNMSVVKLCT